MNSVNKRAWDSLIAITGVVTKVEPGESTWVIAGLKPQSLLSGSFDPGTCSSMRIAYRQSIITIYPDLKIGDEIIVVCFRKRADTSVDDADALPENAEYGVIWANVDLAKTRFMGLEIISGPDREIDVDARRERVKLLQEKIREIRAFKK
ncbi:hypothetical protein [Anatilimnocola floriformis]|uniref:hypothetical protein n=1 Tax=Anatilimnocola floriformis TaxID=2948575 RepID=UPI0020C21CE1|nr:hypothetical protein [Anatilimnocola floriformis]